MTLPFAEFPLDTALQGIREAGFEFVAWGTTHREAPNGMAVPVLAADATPEKSKELADRCIDMGLKPVMMFSQVYPEAKYAVERFTSRIRQAAAANIGQVLTFGHVEGDHNRGLWIDRLRSIRQMAAEHGVTAGVKQHGGATATGMATTKIVREVDSPNILVNYDAGNVMDYLNVDPIQDLQSCSQLVRSFCIKDHRDWSRDEDCGPGFGEIDHYRLLYPVAFMGRDMPLCCENVFAPLVSRPTVPAGISSLARRARVYLETVVCVLRTLRTGM